MEASRIRLISVAFAPLLLATIAASAAEAETRVPYQITSSRACSNTSVCPTLFPITPANRRVEVENVACLAIMSTEGAFSELVLYSGPPDNEQTGVPLNLAPDSVSPWQGSRTAYTFNEPASLYVLAGNRVAAYVGTVTQQASLVIRCSLFGTLVFLP